MKVIKWSINAECANGIAHHMNTAYVDSKDICFFNQEDKKLVEILSLPQNPQIIVYSASVTEDRH